MKIDMFWVLWLILLLSHYPYRNDNKSIVIFSITAFPNYILKKDFFSENKPLRFFAGICWPSDECNRGGLLFVHQPIPSFTCAQLRRGSIWGAWNLKVFFCNIQITFYRKFVMIKTQDFSWMYFRLESFHVQKSRRIFPILQGRAQFFWKPGFLI